MKFTRRAKNNDLRRRTAERDARHIQHMRAALREIESAAKDYRPRERGSQRIREIALDALARD